MKVLHMISGGDKGGAKTTVLNILRYLSEEIDIRACCFMRGVFYDELEGLGLPSLLFEQKHRYDMSIIPSLARHIRAERYDVIHAHGARANTIAVFLKFYIKTPIVTTIHSDYRLDFTQNLYKRLVFTSLNSCALRFLDYYIAVSDSFKDMLTQRGFKGDRIYTVYNTVDYNKKREYESRDVFLGKHGVKYAGKTLVGIVGRLDKVKGHKMFLSAAAEALKTRSDLLFLLAGSGDEQDSLERQADKLGIRDNVVFLGWVDNIFSFYNAVDINVVASESETFPFSILEGSLMKMPTVSTAVGGIVDLIKEGQTGLLCEYGDHRAMARQILRLAGDKDLRAKLGLALLEYARANFTNEAMKRRHIDIYKSIVKRQRDNGKLYDVILSGYYGFNNNGDNALLKAIVDSVRANKPDAKILVLTKKKRETSGKHDVTSIYRYNFLSIANHMRRSRVFVYGGGSLIQDITSTRSLVYYTFVLKMAKKYGLKCMIYANGIGPITKQRNEKPAGEALGMCDYVSLRDEPSMREYERLVHSEHKGKAVLSSDPVFSVTMSSKGRIDELYRAEGLDAGREYLALSFRNWGRNHPDFAAIMANSIENICREYGLTPLYIPMQPDDALFMQTIAQKCQVKGSMLKGSYDAEDLIGLCSRMKLCLAMRLHLLIYSVCADTPCIGVVYDPKVRALLQSVGQDSMVDCENPDASEILSLANQLFHDYDQVKLSIRASYENFRKDTVRDTARLLELIDTSAT